MSAEEILAEIIGDGDRELGFQMLAILKREQAKLIGQGKRSAGYGGPFQYHGGGASWMDGGTTAFESNRRRH